jgi:SagB-type dehydrogenase family enzyme
MSNGETVRRFHQQTENRLRRRTSPRDVAAFTPMDAGNKPVPFKRYRDVTLRRLPVDLPPSALPAADVIAGRGRAEPVPVDCRLVAALLFFSGGVTRIVGHGQHRAYFRAAASAGNLHPLETYLVSGDLTGLDAGVYHFAPDAFGLELLRAGDHRSFLADAAADTSVHTAPAILVITGIPWRTAWKYAERGWRHVHWDAGTMLANLLAVAEAHGIGVRLLFGFQDAALCRLLGVDGTAEFPVVVASLAAPTLVDSADSAELPAPLEELGLATTPLSRAPIEFPLITAAQRAGRFGDKAQLRAWRESLHGNARATSTIPEPTIHPPAGDPIETVIRRRGSTRIMQHATVPADLLSWAMACATRPTPIDALPAGTTLLTHHLSIHAVDGYQPGFYRWADGELALRRPTSRSQARATAAHLCLDQALGADSAYTLFACADPDHSLGILGDRGYRLIQTEAGIVVGRLQLAAHALGYGATGLTFYDPEVTATFQTPSVCMMACSVGVPAYQSVPGGTPGHPTELGRARRARPQHRRT